MAISMDGVNQAGQVLRRAAIEARYQSTREQAHTADAAGGEDRLEISAGGREAARLRQVLAAEAAGLPEVREERVAAVRERIASGFYMREDVVGQISDRLMADARLRPAGADPTGNPDTAYREGLMREVDEKIHSGFYSDSEVMQFVADKLLNIYQIEQRDDGE